MVFLGDLGRDLPSSERDYWRTFNVAPAGRMSETAFRRSILGQFTDPKSPDLQFKWTYQRFRGHGGTRPAGTCSEVLSLRMLMCSNGSAFR